MNDYYGFKLVWQKDIKELHGRACLYRYEKNGAEVLSIENDDENKVFGLTFRTPPKDSTGVAHILEHSVLCGSRKYPVKEPFVELLKGSLQTFLNALTFPDKTCYPVASQNVQDFYNLIDVYLDAVFYPNIDRDIFAQEGWHLELEDSSAPLKITGVVYNEMKGAYSYPEGLLYEYSQQSLFPDTPYGLDSGGNPEYIPKLSYEEFKDFHSKYYHPSNARIFFYGDDDPQERLRYLSEYLKDFSSIEVDSEIALQSRFSSPKKLERFYLAEDESEDKSMLTVNWLLDITTNVELNIAFQVLDYLLIGMSASPLRRALIDSGLGEDLAGVGLENELQQVFFSVGLKGVKNEDLPEVENLIINTIERLSREGFDFKTVEAALNSVEFELRENNTGSMPRGLIIMLRSLSTWLYNSDPALLLSFEKPLNSLKNRILAGEPIFERLLQRYFVNNAHRSIVTLKPDSNLKQRLEQGEKEKIQEVIGQIDEDKLQEIIANTQRLKRKQQAPDDPKDLAKIPSLKIEDLPQEITPIPLEKIDTEFGTILYHDLFTNDIAYVDLGFDISQLPQKYLGLVPLFARALVEMGTDKEDFISLSQRIQAKTGGIHFETFTSCDESEKGFSTWLFVRGKAMQTQVQELVHIFQDILTKVNFNNKNRFQQLLLEEKSREEKRLIPAGHQVVNTRLRSKFNLADWAQECMNGISYLLFLRYLAENIDNKWQEIKESLEDIRDILVNQQAMITNVTLDNKNWEATKTKVTELLSSLPSFQARKNKWSVDCLSGHEGLTISAQVNYIGKGLNLYDLGYKFHASSLVVNRYLRTTYLWDKVRVQGGAYGAFSIFDRFSGIVTFISYRDPNLLNTLKTFDTVNRFLLKSQIDEEEIRKAIIGAIGDMDKYMLPDAKGFTSMLRYLIGDRDETRQRIREEIFSTTKEDFQNLGQWFKSIQDKGLITVLGDKSNINKALQEGINFEHIWQVL